MTSLFLLPCGQWIQNLTLRLFKMFSVHWFIALLSNQSDSSYELKFFWFFNLNPNCLNLLKSWNVWNLALRNTSPMLSYFVRSRAEQITIWLRTLETWNVANSGFKHKTFLPYCSCHRLLIIEICVRIYIRLSSPVHYHLNNRLFYYNKVKWQRTAVVLPTHTTITQNSTRVAS